MENEMSETNYIAKLHSIFFDIAADQDSIEETLDKLFQSLFDDAKQYMTYQEIKVLIDIYENKSVLEALEYYYSNIHPV